MNRRRMLTQLGIGALTVGSMSGLQAMAESWPKTDPMPGLFVGHGSPMNAIEDNRFVRGYRELAQSLPKPKAILCISAHWFIDGTRVTAMKRPRTIHDFGGFPRELHEAEYPAPGSPELADFTAELAKPVQVGLDQSWGFDHGSWTVAMQMYPQADVPIVQLSIDRRLSAEGHFELGQRINELRNRGVLVMGSGNLLHNLRLADLRNIDRRDYGFDWAIEARQFINQHISEGNYRPLFEYKKQGRSMELAIPTPDHFLPLLYILGLQHDPANHEFFNDELIAGSLSMTSLKVS